MADLINEVRFYHFISGVLAHQQADPFCSKCKALANTAEKMKEDLAVLESVSVERLHTMPSEVLRMLEEAREVLGMIRVPEDAVGQKKAGNCKMPEGVCFVKRSKAIFESL